MIQNPWSLVLVGVMAALTFLLGYVGSRRANTTPDFLVARRAVPATRNAAAISGEYLSAASFLDTMGPPHILVRFSTDPDGRAARRTTVRVLGLLGLFYAFPAVYGLLGRCWSPRCT